MNFAGVATIAAAENAPGGAPQIPTVSIEAYNGGAMLIEGYSQPVAIDLAHLENANGQVPLYRNHSHERIVGHGDAAHTEGRLTVEGALSGVGKDTEEIVATSKRGFPWKASIGVQPLRIENVKRGRTATVNGQTIQGPCLVCRRGRLIEVSLVSSGADSSASAAIAANVPGLDPGGDDDDQAGGNDGGANGGDAGGGDSGDVGGGEAGSLSLLSAMLGGNGQRNGQAGEAGGDDNPFRAAEVRRNRLEQLRTVINASVERGSISADQALNLFQQQQQIIQAGGNIDAFNLELLQLGRADNLGLATNRQASRRGTQFNELQIMTAAFARACAVEEENEPEQLRSQVDRHYGPGGCTIGQLVNAVARHNGYRSMSHNINREMLEYAFPPVFARGPSTYDLGGVLSNIANKMLRDAFNYVESSWRDVSAIGRTSDFKEMTTYSLTGDFKYKQVPPGGEITHADMGERPYTNKADTFARLLTIDRRDLINDDLNAFDRVRQKLGRGAALSFNDMFWTEFLKDESTWWSLANNNLIDLELSDEGLQVAEKAFLDQIDYDGEPLGSSPAVLLCTTSNVAKGRELTQHPGRMGAGSTDRNVTTSNQWQGRFGLSASAYLDNARIPNGLATAWWLLSSPLDLPTIEAVFLNGQQFPTIESAAADFDTLGISLRGYHDWGMRKQEVKASVRSSGTVTPTVQAVSDSIKRIEKAKADTLKKIAAQQAQAKKG